MGIVNYKIQKRRRAIETLKKLLDNPEHVLIIHYACEGFYGTHKGKTSQITSIAVRFLNSGQTKSFSIHKTAEIKKIPYGEIKAHIDEIEKEMLDEFFEFVTEQKKDSWIHWSMRDINYGFDAIQHRYSLLGGSPMIIDDPHKFDLARLLIDIYGVKYIGHPRLTKLIEFNKIGKMDYLTGDEEVKAFEEGAFVKLHQSTLRKVDILHNIAERTVAGKLKTRAKLRDIYGLSPQGIFELIKDNWLFALIWTLVILIIGGILGLLIQSKFP